MIEGIASSSFGLNVARLAQLPESVVRRAAHKADEMGRLCEQPRHVSILYFECLNFSPSQLQ